MFHVKHEMIHRIGEFLQIEIGASEVDLLTRYRDWIRDEAIPAGGLGPAEHARLDKRHLADSLLFAAGFDRPPEKVRDLGSGIGLPGIPLAIVFPDAEFELIDRSGRRVDLARRAARVLDLGNVTVKQGDFVNGTSRLSLVVSRASLPPDRMHVVAGNHLETGGVCVLGGSWRARPVHAGWETIEIPSEILDQPVWLLIMRRQ